MFCYHCPPSIHPAGPHPPRLPSLDYPFAPTHPCKWKYDVVSFKNINQEIISSLQ